MSDYNPNQPRTGQDNDIIGGALQDQLSAMTKMHKLRLKEFRELGQRGTVSIEEVTLACKNETEFFLARWHATDRLRRQFIVSPLDMEFILGDGYLEPQPNVVLSFSDPVGEPQDATYEDSGCAMLLVLDDGKEAAWEQTIPDDAPMPPPPDGEMLHCTITPWDNAKEHPALSTLVGKRLRVDVTVLED